MRLSLNTGRVNCLTVLAPLLLLGGCHSPTQPAPATIKEPPFTGTLQPGGSAAFPFSLTATGDIVVTLVSLDPLSTITVGIGLGTPSAGTCNLLGFNAATAVGQMITDSELKGDYCVSIYDNGDVTQPVNFTIQVVHS
jgi:hypothetical protein